MLGTYETGLRETRGGSSSAISTTQTARKARGLVSVSRAESAVSGADETPTVGIVPSGWSHG